MFLAGGEFPVPVPQSSDTISIEWKQYGVSLSFTPTLVNNNRINLHVRPEVSQLSDVGSITLSNISIPALITRRAETTLELNSGQSFALAGLLNNQQTQSIEKFPFLGDIPVLGPLFRSTRFQNNESELVIIITPYIVKPATQEELSLPTDGFISPTDEEFMIEGRRVSKNTAARKLSGEPRAVIVENPKAEKKPAALTAPKEKPVKKPAPKPVGEKKEKPVKAPYTPIPEKPKAKPAPKPVKPVDEPSPSTEPVPSEAPAAAPTGPGGFILE